MTQKELVLEYIKEKGSIVPARVGGSVFNGEFFGSETSKRCRELRAEGKLDSRAWAKDTKFEEFFINNKLS